MRVAIGVAFCQSLFVAFAWSQSVGTQPSQMEAFANRHGVHTVWSAEIARWKDDRTVLVITALVLENSAPSPRKVNGGNKNLGQIGWMLIREAEGSALAPAVQHERETF